MVKVRSFNGLTFKADLYQQILHKNMEYLNQCSLLKQFNSKQMVQKGLLVPQKQQYIYLYQQQYLGLVTLGVLAELSLQDYQQNRIKKHQKTLIREHLNQQTYAKNHVGPVIVGHQYVQLIDGFLRKTTSQQQPFAVWSTVDGRKHRLWKTSLFQDLINQFNLIQVFYILDGHHRFQAASNLLVKLGENAQQKNKWIQGLIYSTKYVRAYPQFRKLVHKDYNNIIRYLMNSKKVKVQQIQKYDVETNESEIVLFHNNKFYQIDSIQENIVKRNSKKGVEMLDQILKQAFEKVQSKNINPIKFMPSIFFDWGKLYSQTHPIFLVKSPSIEAIFQIANQNKTLPPKSTWLQPKPCLHMVIRLPY